MFAHGLMLHHFTDPRHPAGQGALTAQQLRAMLKGMGTQRFLSPSEWMERVRAGTLEPQHLCITLDDGLLCQYDVALPVFEELGLTAFWFVYSSVFQGNIERLELYRYFRTTAFEDIDAFYEAFSDAARSQAPGAFRQAQDCFDPATYLKDFAFYTVPDRWFRFLRDEALGVDGYNAVMDGMLQARGFDPAQVRDLLWLDDARLRTLVQKGHAVGLHSTTHPTRLERLTPAQQRGEYEANFNHIRAATGVAPRSMSHPCNSYTPQTLALLWDMGIQTGFRSNMARQPGHGPLELPREDHANLMHLTQPAGAGA